MLSHEHRLKAQGYTCLIGVDEAGRGPLAGPVVAAAVCLKGFDFKNRIDDSKKLNPAAREKAFAEITSTNTVSVISVSHEVIDLINILQATRQAMSEAVMTVWKSLGVLAEKTHVLIDGPIKLDIPLSQTPIIGGDACSLSIAAASIVAKVTRDECMRRYDAIYPGYGFSQHKGYPTAGHRKAITDLGLSAIHRRSFCGC